jgi:hypothetical protein
MCARFLTVTQPLGIGSKSLPQALGFMRSGFIVWRTVYGAGDLSG